MNIEHAKQAILDKKINLVGTARMYSTWMQDRLERNNQQLKESRNLDVPLVITESIRNSRRALETDVGCALEMEMRVELMMNFIRARGETHARVSELVGLRTIAPPHDLAVAENIIEDLIEDEVLSYAYGGGGSDLSLLEDRRYQLSAEFLSTGFLDKAHEQEMEQLIMVIDAAIAELISEIRKQLNCKMP